LLWKDVAAQIGTDATNVANWSKGHTTPGLKFWPRIIQFLGYDPRSKGETVGERLRHHRERRGWSRPEVARRLAVSVSVLWRWESGRRKPRGKYLAKVYAFLGDDPGPAPVTVGEELRRRREQWGLTLIAMAKLLGVVQSTLCRWESGEREPAGAYLARAEALLKEAADSDSPGK
jgi:transcriptional regulator with XRE-family HTH domain